MDMQYIISMLKDIVTIGAGLVTIMSYINTNKNKNHLN